MIKKFLKHFKKDSNSIFEFFKKLSQNPKIIFPFGFLFIFIIFGVFLNIANANKIIYGVKIGEERIGGLPAEKTKKILNEKIEKFNDKARLKIKNEIIETAFNELGFSIDVNQTIENISIIGKKDNFLKNSLVQINSLITSKKVDFELKIDSSKFELFIKNKLSKFENPAKNASLILNKEKNDFTLSSSSEGIVIDREKLLNDITNEINNLKNNPIKLTFKKDYPKVTDGKTNFAEEKAKKIILLSPFILKYENKQWELNKSDIADMLEFNQEFIDGEWRLGVSFNEKNILSHLMDIAPIINQEPVNAILTQKNGKVVEFALSRLGQKLDADKNLSIIKEKIINFENKINLIVDIVEPKISTKNIENLGITSLLAVGESDFAGSPPSRIHNIKVGTEKFNGILISPEEEFSFNNILGEVDDKTGFKAELVIKKDRTVPEFGGGLCQVSTTMFRAAMLAGLPILERYPHAYPVKYYNPQGFDATIYPPSPDLKFKNDTPGNILIQAKIKSAKLYFEFYGANDGRKIKIDGPKTIEKNPDGSMKTILTREIYNRDGNLVKNSTFKSNYKSPNLYPIYRNPLE